MNTFLEVISQKKNIEGLELCFTPQQETSENANSMAWLLYDDVLPAVTKLLTTNTIIRRLMIYCHYPDYYSYNIDDKSPRKFLESIYLHPLLETICVKIYLYLLACFFNQEKKKFIDLHQQNQPSKALPEVYFL